MDTRSFVQKKVKSYYWDQDINCATTTLLILSEKFGVKLLHQVVDAALGMHGAGESGAQCGLVEGTLMFSGIIGRIMGIPDHVIVNICREFAVNFEKQFSSLLCSVLRPEGFSEKNPPHLCESLTIEAICFNIEFMDNVIRKYTSTASDNNA